MTIDEILAAMPEPAADGDHEYLVIDPATRGITVPEAERVFGVTGDARGDRKYFICPRIVGAGLDLSTMFLRVNFRNANGEEDGYLVNDVAVEGEYVTFSWLLSPKATGYIGAVRFSVCASLTKDGGIDWNTTLASGDVLEGLHPDAGDGVEEQVSDVVTQLRAEIKAGTAAVAARGAEQVQAVQNAGAAAKADAVAAIQAQADTLTRGRAAAIVCAAGGEVVHITDASNDPLQGLRIFGRSIQDVAPTPDNPVEIVSIKNPTVSVDGQSISIPRNIPGIPVTSGGNYTDADGQRWAGDVVDFARGVQVHQVKEQHLSGTEGWLYHEATGLLYCLLSNCGKPTDGGLPSFSNCYARTGATGYQNIANGEFSVGMWSFSANHAYLLVKDTANGASVEKWREYLSNRATRGDPVKIWYPNATPTETALTDAEIAAYRALHTNKPNTTVLNDAGAYMAVEYAADPKLYIDNKLAALVAANN